MLSFGMDNYFECENFWGDFENNLAFLSREMVMVSVDTMLDAYMDTFDEDNDDSLKGMKEIVVIGHSLSPVDYPYFRKITKENLRPNELQWKISWYSDADKDRMHRLWE